MEYNKHLVSEASLSRTWSHMQKHASGTITAERFARDCGEGEKYTRADNKKRNKSLQAKLQNEGYSVTSVKGKYIENFGSKDQREVGEKVFLVVDIKDRGNLEKRLRQFGEEFEQDSILFITKGGQSGKLIGTNKCPNGYPGYGKIVNYKNPVFGKKGEFFTRVSGRPFVLKEESEFYAPPEGFFGRWACHSVAQKHWKDKYFDQWLET